MSDEPERSGATSAKARNGLVSGAAGHPNFSWARTMDRQDEQDEQDAGNKRRG